MTAPIVSLTQSQITTALRAFLLSVLPAGVAVVRGQDNRVAEPQGADFVVLTPLMRERLETNVSTWTDGYPTVPGTRRDLQPTRLTVQLDVHGPGSGDNVQIVSTLFRSDVACMAFAASGFDIMPLYTSDPRQTPFRDGEQQYEDQWSVDAVLQCNVAITTAQDFAGALHAGIIEVDATYPP